MRISTALPIVLTALTLVAGCGRAPQTVGVSRAQAAYQARNVLHEDELCNPAVAAKVNPNAPAPEGIRRAALHTSNAAPRPELIEIPSPNRNDRPNGASDITTIVLHHTASPADAKRIGGFFSQPSAKVSSHYVVGKDGLIVLCVPDSVAAWHAGKSAFQGRDNVNGFSVGIEICNTGDANDPYPQPQYEALGKLMAYLMTTHNVGWKGVTRHRDVALPKGRKNDTSDGFSRPTLEKLTELAGGPAATASTPDMRIGLVYPNFN